MKAKRVGEKKPYIEAESGEQLSVRTGEVDDEASVIDTRCRFLRRTRPLIQSLGSVVHECM